MLKVTGYLNAMDASVIVDDYIPISFRCPAVSSVPSVWWRTGNMKSSLIEIGISNEHKAIYDVTIVCLREVSRRHDSHIDLGGGPSELVPGLPLVDVSRFENFESIVRVDEPNELISYVERDSLFVWFGETVPVSRFYSVDRISFGTNARDEICVIKVDSLAPMETQKILGKQYK